MKSRLPKIKSPRKRLISVIIPVYRQEKTIQKDIQRVAAVLNQIRYDWELIVVVDGKKDDHTWEKLSSIKLSKVKITGYDHNQGKGHAVRYGMARAKGEIVAFLDAGMDLNPNGLSMLLEHFEWYDADIIVGSKRHPVSKVNYPFQRKILSWGYQILCRILFGLNVRDTQVGMKFFRREVLKTVLPRLLVKQYAFDIEILSVAHRLGYRRIFEAPIEIEWNEENSLVSKSTFRTIFNMMIDTAAVFYRLKILRYYDNHNKHKWKRNPELTFKLNIG